MPVAHLEAVGLIRQRETSFKENHTAFLSLSIWNQKASCGDSRRWLMFQSSQVVSLFYFIFKPSICRDSLAISPHVEWQPFPGLPPARCSLPAPKRTPGNKNDVWPSEMNDIAPAHKQPPSEIRNSYLVKSQRARNVAVLESIVFEHKGLGNAPTSGKARDLIWA